MRLDESTCSDARRLRHEETTMNTNLSSSAFGKVQNAFDPRIFQFAMKLYF